MELILTPLELINRLSKVVTPPRLHKHRYCGVLAPNAKLRQKVIESAGPSGATLQLLQQAQGRPPKILPARAPPLPETEFSPKSTLPDDWPEMDQTQGVDDAGWD